MAEIENKTCPPTNDPAELEFRNKNLHFSFTNSLYSAFGNAAFIGLLGTLVKAAVDVSAGVSAASALFAPVPLLVMGGLMAVGTFCIYMSQKEYTELRCLGDQHLARATAKEKVKQLYLAKNVEPSAEVEHEGNCRADGKQWAQVVRQDMVPSRA